MKRQKKNNNNVQTETNNPAKRRRVETISSFSSRTTYFTDSIRWEKSKPEPFKTVTLFQRSKNSIYGLPVVKTTASPNIPGVHLYSPTKQFSLPDSYLRNLWSFRCFKSKHTAKIIGKRNEVYVSGAKSRAWKLFILSGGYNQDKRGKPPLFTFGEEYDRFIRTFQSTIVEFARNAGFRKITMSPDVVALVGADKQQTPHVDLALGQMQVILTLTDGAQPTLVFHKESDTAATSSSSSSSSSSRSHSLSSFRSSSSSSTSSSSPPKRQNGIPSVPEAFDLLQIDPTSSSPSRFAKVLHFAPAMALPKAELLAGMVPVLDSSIPSSTTWKCGQILIADHTIVHAGPGQPCQGNGKPPRMVLFTTFTCHPDRYTSNADSHYNVSDQYLPYHFLEDPTMPPKRAVELLKEWKDENPHLAYPNNAQSKACAALLFDDVVDFTTKEIEQHLEILRFIGTDLSVTSSSYSSAPIAVHKEGECLLCVAGSGQLIGHQRQKTKTGHVWFVLPSGWTEIVIDESKSLFQYISSDGIKRFREKSAVQRYVNGDNLTQEWTYVYQKGVPCPSCCEGADLDIGHLGRHITFLIPDGWKKDGTTATGSDYYYISPDGLKRFAGIRAVERYLKGKKAFSGDWRPVYQEGVPCPKCCNGAGLNTGHEGRHVTFVLPVGWIKQLRSNSSNVYYWFNPDRTKQFVSLPAVKRFVNEEVPIKGDWKIAEQEGVPCPKCLKELNKNLGHEGKCVTFQLPPGWKDESNIGGSKIYISPNSQHTFKTLPEVERYVNGTPCLNCVAELGNREGHRGKCRNSIFVLPHDWKRVSTPDNISTFTWISPDGLKYKTLAAVERIVNAIPCPSCIQGAGKLEGHRGDHVHFILPLLWTITIKKGKGRDKWKRTNIYVTPDGSKRFKTLNDVQEYVNATACPNCVPSLGNKEGHKGKCVTFVLPKDWSTEVKIRESNGAKSYTYVSPDGSTSFKTLPEVKGYVNKTPCPNCVPGAKTFEGHKGTCVSFLLPLGWTTEVRIGKGKSNYGAKIKIYVSPDGSKHLRTLGAVQQYLEVELSSEESSEDEESDSDEEEDVHQRYKSGDREGECRKNCSGCHQRYASGDKEGECRKNCTGCIKE